jgi:AmpD protein
MNPGSLPAPATLGPIDAQGWLAGARRQPSPNCDERPSGCAIELLVIHCISLPPGRYAAAPVHELFTNRLDPAGHPYFEQLRDLRVSAHFLVERDGGLVQFVSCARRAWHAGRSSWDGRSACNDFSIGVELVGSEFEPYADAQYRTLADLQAALCAAYPIRAARGHSEIAPDRKTDPGPLFDWSRVTRDPGAGTRLA